jgi:hypothetical protein
MQVEMIKEGEEITLPFSAHFIQRLQGMLTYIVNEKSPEEVREANQKISQDQELTEWEENYETLLILVASLEAAAQDQGKTELVDVPQQESSNL